MRVMCGMKLWAPFHPSSLLSAQNLASFSANCPVGQAYKTYSLGSSEFRVGSLTCARSQSEASCTLRCPVAANAFSLMINNYLRTEFYIEAFKLNIKLKKGVDDVSRYVLS